MDKELRQYAAALARAGYQPEEFWLIGTACGPQAWVTSTVVNGVRQTSTNISFADTYATCEEAFEAAAYLNYDYKLVKVQAFYLEIEKTTVREFEKLSKRKVLENKLKEIQAQLEALK